MHRIHSALSNRAEAGHGLRKMSFLTLIALT